MIELLLRFFNGDILSFEQTTHLLELLLNFFSDALWPLLLLIVAIIFKGNIRSLVDGIVKLRAGMVEAEIQIQKGQRGQQSVNVTAEENRAETSSTLLPIEFEGEKQKIERLEEELEFERIFSFIFGSQVDLLRKMCVQNSGVFRLFFEIHFNETKALFSGFSEWTVDQYISYLISTGLIEISEPKIPVYRITEKGKKFLHYIGSKSYPKKLF